MLFGSRSFNYSKVMNNMAKYEFLEQEAKMLGFQVGSECGLAKLYHK